ncbi:MAG TPA: hypothetical protein PKN21_12650, partial [Bacteroidales bacterium]|nr:hypothetical protein [Bacteroidales bacterium]
NLFTGSSGFGLSPAQVNVFKAIQPVSWASWILILLVISIYMIRRFALSHRKITTGATWGCGYEAGTPKIQYTAGSFVRSYSKLFSPFLQIGKHEDEVKGIFPQPAHYHTHPYDKVERWLIDEPLKHNKSFMGRFVFLHNGKLQFYILYGVIFILAVISIPFMYEKIYSFIELLKQL